ncbi:MAG: glycosyltransferase [Nitrososphaerota archaeon]|jgi:glycosyltransferase involved in cell wall biosynthesis|nr:glycosyltransferase [Nitrososphaerota archaeon]
MQRAECRVYPLITVGIVVFNREWIIEKMLRSLQSQTYPHNRLFVVVVDGGSKDSTVKVMNDFLAKSDFYGYEVIVEKTNIPEARNLCIKKMQGEFIIFWDSDVVVESTSLVTLLDIHEKEKIDIVGSEITAVFVDSADKVDQKWNEWIPTVVRSDNYVERNILATAHILISRKVTDQLHFDPDLTFGEDRDFSLRAIQRGFKIVSSDRSVGLDINCKTQKYSNIYGLDMSLKESWRGMRKKGGQQAEIIITESGISSASKSVTAFFRKNKRYLTYLGYIPILALSICGLLIQNIYLSLIFPGYFLSLALMQIVTKGIKTGLKATIRSIIIGIPTTYVLLYYCIKYIIKTPKFAPAIIQSNNSTTTATNPN